MQNLFHSGFGALFLVHTQLIKSVAGSLLLNSMSLLYSKFTIIAPWFQCDAMDGRADFNLCFKTLLLCVLNWVESTFSTQGNIFLICDTLLQGLLFLGLMSPTLRL